MTLIERLGRPKSTRSMMKDNETLREAGLFPRIVTHEQARQAAKNFIDAHFRNADGKGVLIGIPARPDHDDLILTDYIRQREAFEALMQPEIDRRVAEEKAKLLDRLRDARDKCSHPSVVMGTHPDEGFLVICKSCGAELKEQQP